MTRLASIAALALALSASGCLIGSMPAPNPADTNPALGEANSAARETAVVQQLKAIANGQELLMTNKGKYGTIDDLVAAGHINRAPDGIGYAVTLTVTGGGTGYTVSATPKLYGPDGKRSFYLDQSSGVRGADHNGAAASASDPKA